jgi:cytoskeletal protein RodZ
MRKIMMIIRIFFVAILSVGIASFAAAQTTNPEISDNNDQQQQTTNTDSSTTHSSTQNNNSSSNQQPKADKEKESMADFCRRNPC